MSQIRTCVVGVGFIGAAHIEALRRLGYVDVTALCDSRNSAALAQQLHVPRAYASYEEMLDQERPDAVHICTPNVTHFPIAKYALEHGIHVLCEKPLSYTQEEADELVRLAEASGLVHGVNLHCRFYPMVREMKELIQRGDLGRIFSVHGGYFQDWLLLDTDYSWRLERACTGSTRAVADIGSHWIDAVEFVTGQRITRVLADFATFHQTRKRPVQQVASFENKRVQAGQYEEFPVDTEDYAQVLFQMSSGAKGSMIVSQAYAGRKNQMILSVAGSQRALHWDSESLNELWMGERTAYNHTIVKDPALLCSGSAALCRYPGGHVEGFPDAFVQSFGAFYRAIQTGEAGAFATFQDGRREMEVCEAIARSAQEQRWLEVVPDRR